MTDKKAKTEGRASTDIDASGSAEVSDVANRGGSAKIAARGKAKVRRIQVDDKAPESEKPHGFKWWVEKAAIPILGALIGAAVGAITLLQTCGNAPSKGSPAASSSTAASSPPSPSP